MSWTSRNETLVFPALVSLLAYPVSSRAIPIRHHKQSLDIYI
jgi:hypothetical protein